MLVSRLKVYLAAPSRNHTEAAALIQQLATFGWVQTHDWTQDIERKRQTGDPGRSPEGIVASCLGGVRDADVLVLYHPPWGTTVGAWVELGGMLLAFPERPVVAYLPGYGRPTRFPAQYAHWQHQRGEIPWLWAPQVKRFGCWEQLLSHLYQLQEERVTA